MFSPRNVTREINFPTLDSFSANGAFVIISIFGYLSFLKFIVHFSNWQIKIRIFEQQKYVSSARDFLSLPFKTWNTNKNWFKTYIGIVIDENLISEKPKLIWQIKSVWGANFREIWKSLFWMTANTENHNLLRI